MISKAEDFDYKPFDLAICFLTRMFIPPKGARRCYMNLTENGDWVAGSSSSISSNPRAATSWPALEKMVRLE